VTYPPEDFRPEDSVEHRSARGLLSAFAVALSLFVIPFMTTPEQGMVLAVCGTVAALIMIGDIIWVVKWLISQRKN